MIVGATAAATVTKAAIVTTAMVTTTAGRIIGPHVSDPRVCVTVANPVLLKTAPSTASC